VGSGDEMHSDNAEFNVRKLKGIILKEGCRELHDYELLGRGIYANGANSKINAFSNISRGKSGGYPPCTEKSTGLGGICNMYV
jgi:hypothetical protein